MQEAAKFIWENNPSVKFWPTEPESMMDVYNTIHHMVIRDSKKNYQTVLRERETGQSSDDWIGYSGTGGFYISYELIVDEKDAIEINVEITVDPCLGIDFDKRVYIVEVVDYTPEPV